MIPRTLHICPCREATLSKTAFVATGSISYHYNFKLEMRTPLLLPDALEAAE
jgi:hypothetical protein